MRVTLLVVLVFLPVQFRGGVGTSPGVDPDPSATELDRLVAAYHEPGVDPSRRAWRSLLADAEFTAEPVDVLEFVKLGRKTRRQALQPARSAALTAALASRGATMITVNDTLQVGVGNLPGYAGGVSWLARFPSRRAYVDTVLDRRVLGSSRDRRTAVAEAQVLLGSNVVPESLLDLPPQHPGFGLSER